MKFSGIGGQAVLEGIMMRNGKKYAVAVRKPDGNIAVDVKSAKSVTEGHKWMKVPFVRGVFSFVDALKIGIGTIMYSSQFYDDDGNPIEQETGAADAEQAAAEAAARAEEEDILRLSPDEPITLSKKDASKAKDDKKKERDEKAVMAVSFVLAFVLAIVLFSLLPTFLASFLRNITESSFLIALAEGLLRIAIFVGYVAAISAMKDIKRTYMYHGAEHKCINCVEHELPLTVENVRVSSKQHKRCGTSFLLIVMIISVFVFMFIKIDNVALRMLSRVLMIPVIAGISFEFLQLAGRSESKVIDILSRPGLWLQGLTTKEPDDSMIEVAIAATEAVFDWREFLGIKEEETDAQAEAAEQSEDEDRAAQAENEDIVAEASADAEPEVTTDVETDAATRAEMEEVYQETKNL